jgi:hypothetical protein
MYHRGDSELIVWQMAQFIGYSPVLLVLLLIVRLALQRRPERPRMARCLLAMVALLGFQPFGIVWIPELIDLTSSWFSSMSDSFLDLACVLVQRELEFAPVSVSEWQRASCRGDCGIVPQRFCAVVLL